MAKAEGGLWIVVLGYVVRGPLGGLAWHHLQYVRGLVDLGHEVLFVEDSDDYPSCYDPSRHVTDCDPSYGLAFAARAFDGLGLRDRWAYHDAHAGRWHGPAAGRVLQFCQDADLLLNLSAINPLRPWLEGVPRRALIDTDPVFTQLRHIQDAPARALAARHNAFYSFAENMGRASCSVPQDGFPWRPTRQPIVLKAWPFVEPSADAPFTTVMQWDSYQERSFEGRRYGMKSRSFPPYFELPQRTGARLELALGADAPHQELQRLGWILRDPLEVTKDPWTYQRYIRSSLAEFGVAKQGYVASRSGWFSERTACYLASGRPAVIEDTGLGGLLPVGEGLCAFSSCDEAAAAIEEVRAQPARHGRAAREIAAEYFDSRRVLGRLLSDATSATQPEPTFDDA